MNATLAKAAASGIPIVLLNAGCDNQDIAASGAMTCVGQPEQLAGVAAGQRFAKLGATNVLCVIHQSGQNLLDRCNGIAQGLGVGSQCKTGSAPSSGPACTELTLSTPNAASQPAAGDRPGHLLPAGPPEGQRRDDAEHARSARRSSTPHPTGVKIATFDLSSGRPVRAAEPSMAFAVDQQQYLQGYLPIAFLYLYKKHEGNSTGGGTTVASGPLLVDSTNVSKVAAAIAAGDD